MNRSSGRRRRAVTLPAVSSLTALLVAGVLSACQTQSPTQTLEPYLPADGVAVDNGPVQARNLVLVASAQGGTGVLSGSLINTTTEQVQVQFTAGPSASSTTPTATATGSTAAAPVITLGPRQQTQITDVEIPDVAVAPGSLAPLVVSTIAGDQIVNVPVLPPDGIYSTFTPTPTATESTPIETSSGTTSETPIETSSGTSTTSAS